MNFQKLIGDCATLYKIPVFREYKVGILRWKKTEKRLIAWKIGFKNEKPSCLCDPCWKWLKRALLQKLPDKDISIHRGPLLNNAGHKDDHVSINENLEMKLPTIDDEENVQWEPTPFEVVLWHEAIGHGYRDLGPHPKDKSNYKGGTGSDPTIMEENNARNCLRLQGESINDRVPTYWGWK